MVFIRVRRTWIIFDCVGVRVSVRTYVNTNTNTDVGIGWFRANADDGYHRPLPPAHRPHSHSFATLLRHGHHHDSGTANGASFAIVE